MTDIEEKAQAFLKAVCEENPHLSDDVLKHIAILRLIEQTKHKPVVKTQHCPNCEATEQKLHDFRQEVSDAVEGALLDAEDGATIRNNLSQFIIPAPKPDPLVDVLKDFGGFMPDADDFRVALEARGLEIRSKNDD